MSSNIQVNLQFNANVSTAKKQMQDLQNTLNNVINTANSSSNMGMLPKIQEAQAAAMNLKIALNDAMNVKTGKLNLNAFQQGLKESGMSLKDYALQLSRLGPEGVKAFSQTAQAIAQADTKLFSLSGSMKKLSDTLFNNIRWQLTGGAINMVTSAIRDTISYAKELDTSLNNIRIVTGKTAAQMADFAKEANAAAKILSTSTKEYTDASLIYFQQGLNSKEVKERTNATIKLANVTGESAQQVSEWMTAIWNNFDDGSRTLEYYADVVAKLGAATASSADEIAQGLEKFAAVAETVGLSYEYATAALATVTAETRQSADVVGTAFKTIFARMESLSLGETLEDGTDLGKYSAALGVIGVNIKDANGELKDMDRILTETGERWSVLSKDQQVALAQSVAGVRQYTQFIALMDNWDVMSSNLKMAANATGELNKQQAIYADSVEAAQKRAQAAGESIKNSLLKGEDIADVYDMVTDLLKFVEKLTDSFGGLKGIIFLVVSKLMDAKTAGIGTFFDKLGTTVANTTNLLGSSLHLTKRKDPKEQMMQEVNESADIVASTSGGGVANSQFIKEDFQLQALMAQNADKMSSTYRQQVEWQAQLLQQRREQLAKAEDELRVQQQLTEEMEVQLRAKNINTNEVEKVAEKTGAAQASASNLQTLFVEAQSGQVGNIEETGVRQDIAASATDELNSLKQTLVGEGEQFNTLFDTIEKNIQDFAQNGEQNISTIIENVKQLRGEIEAYSNEQMEMAANTAIDSSIDANFAALETAGDDKKSHKEKFLATSQAFDAMGAEQQASMFDSSQLEAINQQKAAIQGLIEEEAKLATVTNRDTETQSKLSKVRDDIRKKSKAYNKTVKDAVKQGKAKAKADKAGAKELKVYGKQVEKNTKEQKKQEKEQKKLEKGYKKLKKGINDNVKAYKSYGAYMSQMTTGAVQAISGITMLSSAFETLGNKMAKGNLTFSDFLSIAMSVLMSLPQLTKGFSSLSQGLTGLTGKLGASLQKWREKKKSIDDNKQAIDQEKQAENEQGEVIDQNGQKMTTGTIVKQGNTEATRQLTEEERKNAQNSDKVVQGENKKQGGFFKTMISKLGDMAADGPAGWAKLATTVAIIAGLGIAIAAGTSSYSKGKDEGESEKKKEGLQKTIESADKQLEAIEQNQELSTSVSDLTAEYKELKAAGESTLDVFTQMTEKIPELINNYRELEDTLNLDLGTADLQAAYEQGLLTGDFSAYEALQQEADQSILSAETVQAGRKQRAATKLMVETAREGRGYVRDGKFKFDFTENGYKIHDDTQEILQNSALGKYDTDNNKVYGVDMSDPQEVMEFYEAMIDAVNDLEAAGITSGNAYETLTANISEMSDAYDQAVEAAATLNDIAKQRFVDNNADALLLSGKGVDGNDASWGAIDSFEDYVNHREELLQHLQDAYNITREAAEGLLLQSDDFKNYEMASTKFAQGGIIDNLLQQNGFAGGTENESFLAWYNSLSDEDKTLSLSIDYSTIQNVEDLNAALAELHEKMLSNQAIQEAGKLGVDSATFEAYTDILADENEYLEENNSLTKQIGVAQIKANKGLSELASEWDSINKVLKEGNRNTLEYAESIGKIAKALETTFGYKPSTSFIEQHLDDITALINGNKEKFIELQDLIAKDAVKNIELNPVINKDKAETLPDIQNSLYAMLDDLDTSLEIGEGTTLSGDYLKTLQNALDSGQITAEQLQSIMRAKGFEMKITEWKTVPGPKKQITTWETDENGKKKPETEKHTVEQTTMQVPVINGMDDGIGGKGSVPPITVTRSVSGASISNSSLAGRDSDSKKKLKDELDRYHKISEIISDLEREYDRLSAAADRAFGQKKLDLIDQQIAKQHELIEAQKEYMTQIDANLAKDQKALAAYGARFDKSGRITNYDELVAAMVAQANARNTEESDEAYENFKEALAQYEETLNLSEEQRTALQDMLWEEIDLKIEKVSAEVEFKISIDEDSFQWIEYQLGKLGDDAIDAAQKLKLLTDNLAITTQQMDTYQQGIKDTLSASGFSDEEIAQVLAGGDLNALMEGKELTADQVEQLREYRDGLYDAMEAAKEYREQVVEALSAAFEDLNEEMERSVNAIAHYSEIVQGYKDIIDLVGADTLGISNEFLMEMERTSVKLATDSVAAAKTVLDTRKEALAAAEAELEKAKLSGDEETIQIWQDQVDAITESVWEAESELQSAWQEGLQTATDAFAKQIELIQQKFEDSMTGIFGSFEAMQTAFDQAKTIGDLFLDDYQKIYELSKLNRDINKSIESTDSVRAKGKLLEMQEEINALQESNTEMTQYEVDKLRAKYDLRLAEIALEEAQNAKSQVRMRRDSEGNWGYVYTADADSVAKAEQNYEDKLYAYQQKTQQYIQTAQEQLMALPSEMSQAIAEIQQDITLTEEQRQKKIAETKKHYETLYNHWTRQLQISTQDAKSIYDTDWAAYTQATGYKISADEKWIDSWNETTYAQITGFESMEEAQGTFQKATEQMLAELEEAWTEWQANLDAICAAAGTSLSNFKDTASTEMGKVTEASNGARDAIKEIGTAGETAFSSLVASAGNWLDDYQTKMQGYIKKNEAVIASLNTIINEAGRAHSALADVENPEDHSGGKENFDLQVDDDKDRVPGEDLADDSKSSIGGYSAINRTAQQTPQGETIYHLAYGEVDRSFDPTKEIASGLWHSPSKGWYAQLTSGKRAYLNLQDSNTRTFIQDYMRNHTAVIQGKDMERVAGADNEILQFYPNKPENLKNSYLVYTTQKDGHLTHLLRRRNDSSSNSTIMELTSADAREYIQRFDLMHSGLQLFDTGGYTGSWDSSGRLAMLHQKEIVLNAHDTENFLAGIEILREITQAIDLQALSLARTPRMQVSQSLGSQGGTTLQDITVHAEFPNATDRNEIQEAILSLQNYASQFANRKN